MSKKDKKNKDEKRKKDKKLVKAEDRSQKANPQDAAGNDAGATRLPKPARRSSRARPTQRS